MRIRPDPNGLAAHSEDGSGLEPPAPPAAGESGYSTAELLGNAALAIGALGLIWAAIGDMGQEIVDWIGSQLMSG